jgi:hypothetical protein
MKSNYTSADLHSPRRWGFRLSHWDAAILLFGVALTLWLRSKVFPLWWIVPVGVGHFFLFCNVFLVWRRWELVWAVLFVANVLLHTATGNLGWWPACGWQMPVTFFVIFLQLRSPWYHGILARRINPRLDNYLNGTL